MSKLSAIKQLSYPAIMLPEKHPRDFDTKNTKLLGDLTWRMFYHYAVINPELEVKTDTVVCKHFFESFTSECRSESEKEFIKGKKFPADFMKDVEEFYNHYQEVKAKLNEWKKLHKEEDDARKAAEKEKYGWCTVNGNREPIASYTIEPEGIYFGRGDSPLKGYWKYCAEPEDIILNWIDKGKAPKPPAGHEWKDTVSNPNLHELANYLMKVGTHDETFKLIRKKIAFGALSSVKKEATHNKYSNSAKLLVERQTIMDKVNEYFSSCKKDTETFSANVAIFCLLTKGIRIGNKPKEKKKGKIDYTDNHTIGLLGLKMGEHVEVADGVIKFNFVGKDSVSDISEIAIDSKVTDVLKKRADGELFIQCSKGMIEETVLDYAPKLKGVFTPKLSRTMVAAYVMQEALDNEIKLLGITQSSPDAAKILAFNNANLKVAQRLNHQKNVSKAAAAKRKVKEAEQKERYEAGIKKTKDTIETIKSKKVELRKRIKLCQKPEQKEKLKAQLAKLEEREHKAELRIEKNKGQFDFRNRSKNIALGTSKTSYIDPQIGKKFCEDLNLPITKIYNKSQCKQFFDMDIE